MKLTRLYADGDGESHVDEIEIALSPVDYAPPAPPFHVSDPAAASGYVLVRFPPDWDSGLHPTPRRQLLVVLTGEIEGEASDGTKMRLGPGDTLLMEDTTGKGHTARAVGGKDVTALMVHLG